MTDWLIYRGTADANRMGAEALPPSPPSRGPADRQPLPAQPRGGRAGERRSLSAPPAPCRSRPGTGKSSLAYSVAYELGLGPVLRWPITSRSTLAEGLYSYDA